jgi:hypothetical protein
MRGVCGRGVQEGLRFCSECWDERQSMYGLGIAYCGVSRCSVDFCPGTVGRLGAVSGVVSGALVRLRPGTRSWVEMRGRGWSVAAAGRRYVGDCCVSRVK